MRRLQAILVAATLWAATIGAGAAQDSSPQDLVRWMYGSLLEGGQGLALLESPEQRYTYMTPQLASFYDREDTYNGDWESGCRSFGFDIPVGDFDLYEVTETLKLRTVRSSYRMWITAAFSVYDYPVEVMYVFAWDNDAWRLEDIAGDGWRVSQMTCHPRKPSPDWVRGSGFCYATEDATLVMDMAGWGGASFEFQSWQPGGGYCGGTVWATPTDYGWEFWGDYGGGDCRLGVGRLDDGGLYLQDPDWSCAPQMCQSGGAVDGIAFPAWAQVDCFSMGE